MVCDKSMVDVPQVKHRTNTGFDVSKWVNNGRTPGGQSMAPVKFILQSPPVLLGAKTATVQPRV